MGEDYVVEVKGSARRINATAGQWVADYGPRRQFPSKEAARTWARDASTDSGAVRIQDAAPNDSAPIDGYLVADPLARRHEQPSVDSDGLRLDEYDS